MNNRNTRVHTCQELRRLMLRIPSDVQASFTEEQLDNISNSLRQQNQKNHWLDIRPMVRIPFLPWSCYIVILAGRNHRFMSKREQRLAAQILILSLVSGIVILSASGLLVLYLLKSAMGINLFSDFSLGLWDWFTEYWSNQ